MEHPTEKHASLLTATLQLENARRSLNEKIENHTAKPEDMQAVTDAIAALQEAKQMQVCFDCGQGCEKPKQWTQLYQELENENAHLKIQIEEYRGMIERDRTTSSAEVRNLQEDLNQTNERAAIIAGDLDETVNELSEAQKRIEDLESRLLDAKEGIASLSKLQNSEQIQ
jgi:chromosome segregation ATPase